jgi:hypothetical protein
MTQTKHQTDCSSATLTRFERFALEKNRQIDYQDIRQFLLGEGYRDPARATEGLLDKLQVDSKDMWLIAQVGRACAREARELREVLHGLESAKRAVREEVRSRWPDLLAD